MLIYVSPCVVWNAHIHVKLSCIALNSLHLNYNWPHFPHFTTFIPSPTPYVQRQSHLQKCLHFYDFVCFFFIIWSETSLWAGLSVPMSAVDRLVSRSVCHNFLKGREVSLPGSYRSTCNYHNTITIILKLM